MTEPVTQALDAPNPGNGQDPTPENPLHIPEGYLDPSKANELISQKRAANKEAQELKKQMAEVQAQLESYKQKDMSEQEKAIAAASAEKARAAELATRLERLENENLAIRSGAKDADLVAYKWGQHKLNNPEANPDEFITGLKESHPYLFADAQQQPPPKGGQGGPPPPGGSSNADMQQELARTNEEINGLMVQSPGRDRDNKYTKLLARRQYILNKLRKE